MSTRNSMSSHGIELAEAGLEQILYSQNYGGPNEWTTNWTISGGTATRTLTSGFTFENGATGQVVLTVPYPITSNSVLQSEAFVTLPNGTQLKRELRTTASLAPTFLNAVGATQGNVNFSTGGTVDSYDSSLGPYDSLLGTGNYNVGYSAIVLSDYVPPSLPPPPFIYPPTVLLSNAQVDGYAIGAIPNPASYSGSAELKGPQTPTSVMVDTGRILTEAQPYQPQFAENVPGTGTTVAINLSGAQTATLGYPTATAPTIYNVIGDATLSQSSTLYINGPVVLVINGSLSITQNAQITVGTTSPTTGGGPYVSLEVHLSNTGNMNIDGGGINNLTYSPERLVVTGVSNSAGILEMGTNTPFYGVISFPNNALTINNSQQIYGSLVAGSITFNGSPSVHYDSHLRSTMPLVAGPPVLMGPAYNAFTSAAAPNQPMITAATVTEVIPAQ